MTIRIGVNPIGWSNDDMRELGADTPLETCLAEAKLAGFEGIELGHKFPRDAAALSAALAPHGLACVSGWYSASLLERDAASELEHLRPHLDLLKAMGCDVLICAETTGAIHGDRYEPLSQRPVLGHHDFRVLGERLTEVADAIEAEGVRLAYHHHMGTVVQSAHDIHALMSASEPSVRLLLDTGHATWGGADPASLAARYRERIAHVHFKDVRDAVRREADAADWSFLQAVVAGVYTVPGDGGVDFAAVLRGLGGYSGWLVVEAEQDPAKANPLAYARMGFAAVQNLLDQAGMR